MTHYTTYGAENQAFIGWNEDLVCHREHRDLGILAAKRHKRHKRDLKHEDTKGDEVLFYRIYRMIGITATTDFTDFHGLGVREKSCPQISQRAQMALGGCCGATPWGSRQLRPLWCEHQRAKSALLRRLCRLAKPA